MTYITACTLLDVLVAQTARFKSTNKPTDRKRLETLTRMIAGPIRADSAWYRVFETYVENPESVWVGCLLSGGTYVSGILDYFSTEADETADRDLLIGRPEYFDTDGEGLEGEALDRAVVSARSVVRIGVSYVPSVLTGPADRAAGETAASTATTQ